MTLKSECDYYNEVFRVVGQLTCTFPTVATGVDILADLDVSGSMNALTNAPGKILGLIFQ
jgi:hypothetical protein